jgi:ATP-binding cassette subfamily C (CFTR/MRP) protein 1
MRLQRGFTKRVAAHIDEWSRLFFLFKSVQTWGSHVANYITVSIGASASFFLLGTRSERGTELAGLALTYSILLPYFITTVAHHFMQLRTAMASLERLLEYLGLPQEASSSSSSSKPSANSPSTDLPEEGAWPQAGAIEFVDLQLRYRPELPLALSGLSLRVEGGQRAGIVGRTGAGKSSLILALLRLVEPSGGAVRIDGVDLSTLGLARLRKAVAVIPQDPTLHKGSVRHNLDPFAAHSEEALRTALERTALPVSMLGAEVEKGGANLSSGERQLLCFARALLQHRSILVLDEATSNLDAESDVRIQALLRREFAATTTLTIAHRLQTIIDYDLVLVLARGALVEHGPPLELLDRPDGAFAGMVGALGEAGAAALRQRAVDGRR